MQFHKAINLSVKNNNISEMRKKIMILGASRYYSMSIESVKRAGYFVIAVDKNPEADAFKISDAYVVCDTIDKDGVLKAAIEHKIDGIVSVNDYGVPTAAYVAKHMKLPGISEEAAFLSTDKEAMRAKWIKEGVPCPLVEKGTSLSEVSSAIKKVGFPCVLKPAHGIGGGSRGVIVVHNEEEIANAVEHAQRYYENKELLIESFIQSEFEHSAECLVYGGKVYVLAVSDKVKIPLPYRVDTDVLYPSLVTGERLARLKEVVSQSVLSLGIDCGAAHVELATTKDGFCLFELGARCGGGGTPEPICTHVSGINQFLEQVKILVGDKDINLFPKSENPCNYHFIILKPGTIKSIRADFESIRKNENVLDADLIAKAGQVINDVSTGPDRAGFIITKGKTIQEARETAKSMERFVTVDFE
jgi:biotin carboxylase